MDFFIKKNATLPVLKLQVVKDGRSDYDNFMKTIELSSIFFSMVDADTGIPKISSKPAGFVEKTFIDPNAEPEYYIYYQLTPKDTNRVGKYEGQFMLRNDDGVLILPIREKLHIYVQESFIADDLAYESCYVSEFPCCVNGPYTTTTTTTPCPSCGPSVTPSTTPEPLTPTPTPTKTSTPTPTPTPTKTSTPTPTPTPTQPLFELVNPILIDNTTYISIGVNEYLTYSSLTPTPIPLTPTPTSSSQVNLTPTPTNTPTTTQTPTSSSQVNVTPTPTNTPTTTQTPTQLAVYSCTVTTDFADSGVSPFSITINGITYPFGDLWKSTLYQQLESDLNAFRVNGLQLGYFTIEPTPNDSSVGTITVVGIGTNTYDNIIIDYNGNPFTRPFVCVNTPTP